MSHSPPRAPTPGAGHEAARGADARADSVAARVRAARLYLCTDAREEQGDLPRFLDAVLSRGVDIVQLRQKGLEAGRELEHLEVFARACAEHGALLAVNDRADVAFAAGAPVLHLGQGDLPVAAAARIVGPAVCIGRSTHAEPEVGAALADPHTGYFCVGPCWPTPTKPGRPAPGLSLVRYAAAAAPPSAADSVPWFAIGGIDGGTLGEVLEAGARRVVVVRAVTAAADPGAAAEALAARLRAAVREDAGTDIRADTSADSSADSSADMSADAEANALS